MPNYLLEGGYCDSTREGLGYGLPPGSLCRVDCPIGLGSLTLDCLADQEESIPVC